MTKKGRALPGLFLFLLAEQGSDGFRA